MGNSSFFNSPVAYDVVDEGGEGSGFYEGPAYTEIDPVAIGNSVAAAAASATASEASRQASGTSATASAVSAAAALASKNAAATSETNAASSATSASGSASTATTQAGSAIAAASAAATSEANALSSKNAAATSETNALSSKNAAATSATNAATSESNAATSASAASTSAANAAAAVQAAAGTATPLIDGVAAVGAGTKWAREDHKHPVDTVTADARVANAAGTATPLINAATAVVGVSAKWAHDDHVHPTDTTRAPLASPGLTGTPTAPTATAGTNTTQIATTAFVLANAVAADPSLARGYISGLTFSTAGSSTTFSVSAGVAVDSTNASFIKLASALSKTTGAWAVGTGNGALDTGTIAPSTTYHGYVIERTDTGVVDVLVSLSATAPTLPTSYTIKRRAFSMKTNASSQWVKVIQDGDLFQYDVPILDANEVTFSTASRALVTLSLPTGIVVIALTSIEVTTDATSGNVPVLFTDPAATDTAAALAAYTIYVPGIAGQRVGWPVSCRTNTSAQIGLRANNATPANTPYRLVTTGWIDTRGRFA